MDVAKMVGAVSRVVGTREQDGRYQFTGNAGGTITRCDPPRRLAVTWEHGGSVSWLTVALTPAGDATDLEIEHVAHVDDAFLDQFGPGAVGVGWDMGLMGLAERLTGAPEVDPARAAAWGTSEEGKAFVHASSESWADASIAAGTSAPAARASAGRTTAFYTGG